MVNRRPWGPSGRYKPIQQVLCLSRMIGAGIPYEESDIAHPLNCECDIHTVLPEDRRPDLQGADLRGANLRGANLRGSYLYRANLEGADLSHANLIDADLRYAKLKGANLRRANLRNAEASYADFQLACLADTYCKNLLAWRAVFTGADLEDAFLLRADLRGSDLSNSSLKSTELYGSRLKDTTFTGADLQGAHRCVPAGPLTCMLAKISAPSQCVIHSWTADRRIYSMPKNYEYWVGLAQLSMLGLPEGRQGRP